MDSNPVLMDAFKLREANGKMFIHRPSFGGGVHSHIEHLKGLITIAHNKKSITSSYTLFLMDGIQTQRAAWDTSRTSLIT